MKKTELKRGTSQLRQKQLVAKTKILFTSKKKKERNVIKKDIYKEIDKERVHVCEGCNKPGKILSHSHLIPVGYAVRFEAVKSNIRIHCISFNGQKGCHETWEDGILEEITKMNDFKENLQILKDLDPKYYQIKMASIYG